MGRVAAFKRKYMVTEANAQANIQADTQTKKPGKDRIGFDGQNTVASYQMGYARSFLSRWL
jgi:hypothetical protein